MLSSWEELASPHRNDPRYPAVRQWVIDMMRANAEDMCMVWLAGMHAVVAEEGADENPPTTLNPAIMGTVLQGVLREAGATPELRKADFIGTIRELRDEYNAGRIGRREMVQRMNSAALEVGLRPFDGFTTRVTWRKYGEGDNATFRRSSEERVPIHPSLLTEVRDLLPESYQRAAEEIERRDAARLAEREPFDEFAPVSMFAPELKEVPA